MKYLSAPGWTTPANPAMALASDLQVHLARALMGIEVYNQSARDLKKIERLFGEAKHNLVMTMSSPLFMYHFAVEFLAPVVSCLVTDEAGCDCTV